MAINPLKILFVASEVEGLIKTGGLADVAKALPLYLKQQEHDVRIILPFYRTLKRRDEAKLVAHGLVDQPNIEPLAYQIYQLEVDGVCCYLIDYPPYFDRPQPYAENNQAYGDNGERFAFFCAAVLDAATRLEFAADIIHCNDWHTGLIPLLLKTRYRHHPLLQGARSIISIHNAAFQGGFACEQFAAIPEIHEYQQRSHDYDYVNLLKCAVLFADKINAVSPNYAAELLTHLGAHGMAPVFQARAQDLCGILNGCDYKDWDPEFDTYLPARYNMRKMAGKARCKQSLLQEVGLHVYGNETPLYGMVCRLTEQKGVHLLIPALQQFLRHHVQVVIVGSGDPQLAEQLTALAQLHPNKLVFINAYDDRLAHLVEAGADFFLMPSLFEPCGLNQMYSLAYGTLPIVRTVGGLKDTVVDWNHGVKKATGFCFDEPTDMALLDTLRRSLIHFIQDKPEFIQIQRNAMNTRFEWPQAVAQYERMYRQAMQ